MSANTFFAKYALHPAAEAPEDEASVIWRYMNFTRLISLFESRALFFPSISTLKEIDPFEGVWSVGSWKAFLSSDTVLSMSDTEKKSVEDILPYITESDPYTYVNCWHLSTYESQAMWKLYGNEVAIKSSFARFANSFVVNETESTQVYIGKVKYIDYFQEDFRDWTDLNSLHAAFRKNNSFEHEHELRALLFYPEHSKSPKEERVKGEVYPIPRPSKGVSVAVNLHTLIEGIYISTQAEEWYKDLVLSVLAKYELNVPVYESVINKVPDRWLLK